jgi:hypothetical protein
MTMMTRSEAMVGNTVSSQGKKSKLGAYTKCATLLGDPILLLYFRRMLHQLVVATNSVLTSDEINDPRTSESEIVLDEWCVFLTVQYDLMLLVPRALMDARAGAA